MNPIARAELELARATAGIEHLGDAAASLALALRNLARDFAAYQGHDLIAKPGCFLASLTFAGEPILAEYADEEMGTEVQRVFLNGKFVDASPDYFSDWQIEAWADELVAQIEAEA